MTGKDSDSSHIEPKRMTGGRALIDRINLVHDRIMRDLTGTQCKVLLSLIRHADAVGEAFPGLEKMARAVGTTPRKISQAIHDLRLMGMVEVVGNTDAGGRGRSAIYRLILPPKTTPESGQVSRRRRQSETTSKAGNVSQRKHGPKRALNLARNGQKHSPKKTINLARNGHRHNKEERPIERLKNATTTTGRIVDVVGSRDRGRNAENGKARDDALAALEKHGIVRGFLLDEIPGLSADVINEIGKKLPHKAGVGVLVEMIRERAPKMVEQRRSKQERYDAALKLIDDETAKDIATLFIEDTRLRTNIAPARELPVEQIRAANDFIETVGRIAESPDGPEAALNRCREIAQEVRALNIERTALRERVTNIANAMNDTELIKRAMNAAQHNPTVDTAPEKFRGHSALLAQLADEIAAREGLRLTKSTRPLRPPYLPPGPPPSPVLPRSKWS